MYVQLRRHIVFEGVEESTEFRAAMAAVYLADDFSGLGIESGDQIVQQA